MPEGAALAIVREARLRLRAVALLRASAAGAALAGGLTAMLRALDAWSAWPAAGVVLATAALAGWMARAGWRGATLVAAAECIERARPRLDNLLVSLAGLSERPRPVREALRAAIVAQAAERVRATDAAGAVPLAGAVATCAAVAVGAALALGVDRPASSSEGIVGRTAAAPAAGAPGLRVRVRVEPPAYSGRAVETLVDPVRVVALAGSRVRIEATVSTGTLVMERTGQAPAALARRADRFVAEWTANESASLVLRPVDRSAGTARFLSLLVVPDHPPVVRIRAPGRDLVMTSVDASIGLDVEGEDDLGMARLAVRFMRASGSGESMAFSEGEIPLTVVRATPTHWTASGRWAIGALGLEAGDVLAYRAVARDANPSGVAAQSDTFVVEVGRRGGAVSAGAGIPLEEGRFALSQQMLVFKTERLVKQGSPRRDGWIEETRSLAVEQRMVRAEVVFLSGGEVDDEVEEAGRSHELAEGRLENAGRADLTRAITAMSRAEAELNAGRAREALLFEREALAALERAFDRRRYFLRALGERSRIDLARRLTGAAAGARSSARAETTTGRDALAELRSLMRDLAREAAGTADLPLLAARLAGIDTADERVQSAALALARASSGGQIRAAKARAREALAERAWRSLAPAPDGPVDADPLAGRLADRIGRSAAGGTRP